MFDSVIRRVVAAVLPRPRETPAATPPPSSPAASSYYRDSFQSAARKRVDLGGLEKLFPFLRPAELQGPELVHLKDGWTPQGQGYDAGRGQLLTTYYNDKGVLLSVQDKKSGDEKKQVILGGPGGSEALRPHHGGGVSTDGEFVYVSDTRAIYVYRRSDIDNAEPGATVEPIQRMPVPDGKGLTDPATGIGLTSNGSFMAVKDGYAYVGSYSEDGDGKAGAVWRYKLDEQTGALIEESRQGPIRAPDRAQGVTVVDGGLLFTTGDHKLVYQPMVSTEDSFSADIDERVDIGKGLIDPYAQGINIVDGELWVTYESGSEKYRDNVDHPRDHIQRIPLEALDLEAAGLTPEDLEG